MVAKIRGVGLYIHFSLIFLLIYVAFVLTVQFPFILRASGVSIDELSGSPLSWALMFAAGLFASVAVHEFGHAFVGQALGTTVRGITLMMLGGVSEMEQIPERPFAEFKLAIIGPLVSFGLAALFYAIEATSNSANLVFFSQWMADANMVLAIFNLIPAFPLDGGRALRSILAARQGQTRATKTSVKISRVFAWTLGILGFLQLNILLMLIAFFIYSAAQSELFFLLSKGLLQGLKVGEIAIRVDPLEENQNIQDAALQMMRTRHAVLPVRSMTDTPAILSLERIRSIQRGTWQQIPVGQVLEVVPKYLQMDDPISHALPEIATSRAHALPVKEGDRIVGLLKYSDLTEILRLRSLDEPPLVKNQEAA